MKFTKLECRQTTRTVIRTALMGVGIAIASPAMSQTTNIQLPQSMGALGDSMTAGALAGYKRQNSWMPWVEASFLLHVIQYKLANDYHKIEFRNLSWSTGLDSGFGNVSHARRIIELQGGDDKSQLKVMNAAVSGSVVQDVLEDQWPRLQQWSREKLHQEAPDYVTVLIGANDICAETNDLMTSTSDYQQRLTTVIDQITSSNSKTRVLITALPNIVNLRDVAVNASNNIPTMKTCEDVWKAFDLCPNVTLNRDPAVRAEVAQRIVDYNNIMHDVAAKVNAQLADNDRVRVSDTLYGKPFTKDDISMDCFHPNPGGQYKLSRETWSATWWAPLFDEKKDAALQKKAANNNLCRRGANRSSGLPQCIP